LVAFGAIASMGTAFIAIGAFTPETTAAALYYVVHSTLATAALFLVADLVSRRRAHARLDGTAPPIDQAGLIASLYLAAAVAMAGMPPLSGFIGKLLILDSFRDQVAVVWSVILLSSFLMILGYARAGSRLFWKASALEAQPDTAPPEPLAFTATIAVLATLALLTVLAGPITDWLTETAATLYAPDGYIAANHLGQER
jgi:multicomponent K+:H+ antiporter subunit D